MDDDKRLNRIEKKLNTLLTILEGRLGSEGLATQIYKNRESIAGLKALVFMALGATAALTPLVLLFLRGKL